MLLKFLLAELLTIAAEISSLFLVVRSTPLTSLIFSKGSDMKLKHSPMISLDKWSHKVMLVFKQSSRGVLVKRYCRNMHRISLNLFWITHKIRKYVITFLHFKLFLTSVRLSNQYLLLSLWFSPTRNPVKIDPLIPDFDNDLILERKWLAK